MQLNKHLIKLWLSLGVLALVSAACLGSGGTNTSTDEAAQTALIATYTALQAREQAEVLPAPVSLPVTGETIVEDVQPLVVEPPVEACRTSSPGAGGTLWSTNFVNKDCLSLFAISNSRVDKSEFNAEIAENGKYNFRIKRRYTSVYAVADHIILTENDSDIELDVALDYLEGPNEVGFSLLCRVNPLGWYEFLVTSGGRWQIMSTRDSGANFEILASGGIDFRQYGLESFKQGSYNFQASCVGDELTLSVNGVVVNGGNVRDLTQTHTAGSVGFALFTLDSIWDYEENPVLVDFEKFEVRRP